MAFVFSIKISLYLPTGFLIFTFWVLSPSHRGDVGCVSKQLHGAKMLAGDNPLALFLYHMPILLGRKEDIHTLRSVCSRLNLLFQKFMLICCVFLSYRME